ncbi:MAG: hypothetical protein BGO09_03355 [Bacteroidetes bacterium 47-18]|nr:MAG: hypothetical protein BGO09_03355 [Bacteroidetes bacterium 47-18]
MTFYYKPVLSFCVLTLLATGTLSAQRKKGKEAEKETEPLPNWNADALIKPIPANRALFTDYVAKQINKADLKDGKADNTITVKDTMMSRILTDYILQQAKQLEIRIENIEIPHQTKIQYHRALESLLKKINTRNFETIDPLYARRIVGNMEGLILARETGSVKEYVRSNVNLYTLDNADLLSDYPEEKAYLVENLGKQYPEILVNRLDEFANEKYADVVVAAAAKVVPGTILKYALSTSRLSSVVRRNTDPLVQTICKIASQSDQPWMVLPFLNKINSGQMSIKQIDGITGNEEGYLKALVDLKTSGETLGVYNIDQELKRRGLNYIRKVNELHNSPANVRFASMTNLRPEDLYFCMIGGVEEIYTSSFIWMFNRMMEKMKPRTGDQFLEFVHQYHFRTFLRMCAGYNTLTPFLASMDETAKNKLIRQFVADLEEGPYDDLEGAVDLADAYGSIKDDNLLAFIRSEINSNYKRVSKLDNEEKQQKGTIIYGLLSTIFSSADNPEALNKDLSQFIPPIMHVSYSSLQGKDGRVYEVSYFYGDADGKTAYNHYINSFKNASGWNVSHTAHWTTITRNGEFPITIFANKPLPEETGQDEEAQRKMNAYLEENDIHPSIVIHRGHSYYLPATLSYLQESAKIVMLGSCGGYHNLATVLESSPDAHIISSKQVGALNINMPIIQSIDNRMAAGKDVNWLELWNELSAKFSKSSSVEKDLFSDYIPPNRNLGVIFIKAYKRMAVSL